MAAAATITSFSSTSELTLLQLEVVVQQFHVNVLHRNAMVHQQADALIQQTQFALQTIIHLALLCQL